jgi:hypothetical protein
MKRLLVFAALSLATLPAVAQLQIQYGTKSLAVSGASPGGDVVVFGIIHSNYRGLESIQKPESIEHADDKGLVTVTVPRPSFRSVWLVVDLKTGEFLISSPPGYQFRRTAVPLDAIERAGTALLHARPSVDVYVVRRGLGGWHARAGVVGGTSGARDAGVTVGLDRLKPVGATPAAPQVLEPDDIVMVFDAPFMQFWVTKLTPADLLGAK